MHAGHVSEGVLGRLARVEHNVHGTTQVGRRAVERIAEEDGDEAAELGEELAETLTCAGGRDGVDEARQ